MASAAVPIALLVAALNAVACALGAWRWSRVETSERFWPLVRAGQLAAVVLALVAGGLRLAGEEPDDGLFWLYVLLPLAVSFVAEQLRIASAATELETRELADAQAMRGLPEGEIGRAHV